MGEELITQVDIKRIADEGSRIYQGIKSQYESSYRGQFLAIDIESKRAFLAPTSAEALVQARNQYPKNVFYVAKIGYDTAETMAQLWSGR